MKKILIILFCSILFGLNAISMTVTAHATCNSDISTEIQYLSNGSYFITTIETTNQNILLTSTTTTKSKTSTYYDSNHKAQWFVRVTGTFTYGNGSSLCTRSSVTAGSYDTSRWVISNQSASKNGNVASATASAKQYFNQQHLAPISRTVTLTCSATGVFS